MSAGPPARAKYNAAVAQGRRAQYWGLTFWSPNINIFRDPRWGRGHETWGEDPVLTGTLGAAFVRGLQGDHPKYLKAAACAKHYAVHSGPEKDRHHFDAKASRKDMWETYLLEILREKWGFKGHVVSDCGAIDDIWRHHDVVADGIEASALAIKNGCDLNCGACFLNAFDAVMQGKLSEAEIDRALANLLRTRFKLGMFDPPRGNPYSKITLKAVDSPAHRALAREAAVKSIVLLKNAGGVLPFNEDVKDIYLVGPNAASVDVLLGNYHGLNPRLVTVLEGLTEKAGHRLSVRYAARCLLAQEQKTAEILPGIPPNSEAVVAVMGITPLFENEEGDSLLSSNSGDRDDIGLPPNQVEYLKVLSARLREKKTPLVVVLSGGSALAAPEVHELADAVLMMWYPGEEGGNAVADILFGDECPSGKLPLTFPKSMDDLPPFEDYSMENRTYRYAKGEPLYPFGFGLSYARFEYSGLRLSKRSVKAGETLKAEVTVKNAGKRAAEEVVQLYITDLEASVRAPRWSLKSFKRLKVAAGRSRKVAFRITPEMTSLVGEDGESRVEQGEFRVTIGGSCPDPRSVALGAPKPATAKLKVR
ncbi:MAG: glycoside hydrolase family 3 C-terminal domain-containing protein [Planctomycetota bacterium]